MKKYEKRKIWGIGAAGATALLQGFEGIMFLLFALIFTKPLFESVGFATGSLFLKELVTIFFMLIIINPSKFIKTIKLLKNKKETRIFLYAGLFGTSLGNLFYIMAIQFGGAGYGVVLTSFYPIFSIFIIKLLLKSGETENWKVWTGVGISVVGAFLFIILPTLVGGDGKFTTKTLLGLLLGGLVAIFWAAEGVIIKIGLKHKVNRDMSTVESVAIRSISTLVSSLVIFIPLTFLFNSTNIFPHKLSPFVAIQKIITSWVGLLVMLAISLNLVVLRNIHLYAISTIGPKFTAMIDTNNFLVPPLLGEVLHIANLNYYNSSEKIFNGPIWWSWFLIIPIIIGVLLVVIYRPVEKPIEQERLIT